MYSIIHYNGIQFYVEQKFCFIFCFLIFVLPKGRATEWAIDREGRRDSWLSLQTPTSRNQEPGIQALDHLLCACKRMCDKKLKQDQSQTWTQVLSDTAFGGIRTAVQKASSSGPTFKPGKSRFYFYELKSWIYWIVIRLVSIINYVLNNLKWNLETK